MSLGPRAILDALYTARGETLSGEDLSAELGVSRAQIWKNVSTLRKRGYEIEGTPGGGYLLRDVPDRLYPEEIDRGLENRWLGHELHYFEETDSTNRVAAELARKGAGHGTTVIAESQSAGRGRLGRNFFSPSMTNLYTSIVLRPSLDTAAAPTLLLAAGLAVADAVSATLGEADEVEIKWPNDVLLSGLKTSGILMELQAEENQIDFAILGIGVNLNVDRQEFPEEFRARATSLRSHSGKSVDRIQFTCRLYSILEKILDKHQEGGMPAIRPRLDAYFHMLGRRIIVEDMRGGRTEGIATGLAANGALEIDLPSGEKTSLLAGDVTICKDDPQKES